MSERVNTAQWLENQKRWQIKVQKDGVRKTFTSAKKGRAGQREANAKADAWLEQKDVQDPIQVSDLFDQYQTSRKPVVGTSQYRQIQWAGKNWITPHLGTLNIQNLRDGDFQKMIDAAAAKGLAKKTILDLSAVFRNFLLYCRQNGWTTYEPKTVTIPRTVRSQEKKILQPEDVIKVLRVNTTLYYGERIEEPLIYAFRLQLLTGLRPGEVMGLMESDYQDGRIMLRRSININNEVTRGKNENALRAVVPQALALQTIEESLAKYPPKKDGRIFAIPSLKRYRERWKSYCEANQIPYVPPYNLRHTFVSIVKTLPEGFIQPYLGHAQDMDSYGTYAHTLKGEDRILADMIGSTFQKLLNQHQQKE